MGFRHLALVSRLASTSVLFRNRPLFHPPIFSVHRPTSSLFHSGHAGNLREFPLDGNAQSESSQGKRKQKAKQRERPAEVWGTSL